MSYCVFPQLFFIVAASLIYIRLNDRAKKTNKTALFSNTCAILLVIFVTVLLHLALIGRETEIRSVYLTPFWSYNAVLKVYNTFDILEQIFENILVFVPLGILFPEAFNLRGKRFALPLTIGAGFFLSFVIELGQYTYAIGCTELDDLFNNTLGCVVGWSIFSFADYVSINNNGVLLKKGAFTSLLPAVVTVCGALMIILYREIILY